MNYDNQEQIIANLIKTLNAHSWEIRKQASDTLISFGASVVEPLMTAIEENIFDIFTLPLALRTLGGIKDGRVVDFLIYELENKSVHAVQEAVKGLGYIGDPRAIPPLIDMFRHDWNDTETITVWQEASIALAALGDIALLPLLMALRDENTMVRRGVIDALGQLKDMKAVLPLIDMLHDEDPEVRADAAAALSKCGRDQAIKPLLILLTDESSYVRSHTCHILGDIGDIHVFDNLSKLIYDADPKVRRAAVINLGKLLQAPGLDPTLLPEINSEILDIFLVVLKDPDALVRAATIRVLGSIGDESVLPALSWMQQNDVAYAGANRIKDISTVAIQSIQKRS